MYRHLVSIACFALQLILYGPKLLDAQSSTPVDKSSLPDNPQPQTGTSTKVQAFSAPQTAEEVDAPWPRKLDRGDEKIAMYQPQLEAWEGERLRAYAALSVTQKDNKPKYGVVWFQARTEVDKVNRQVTLDDFQITAVKFPTMQEREEEYKAFLQQRLPAKSKVVALDRLEAELAANTAAQPTSKGVVVNNDPPRVIFATRPSTLVLIDGQPKFSEVAETDLQRVVNTQAVILLDSKTKKYYLNVMDGWLETSDLAAGPWSYAETIPKDMKEITKQIKEQQKRNAQKGTNPPSLKKAKEGKIPDVYVSLGPAELIVTEGQPQFERISGLDLEYVKNTSANIFMDASTRDYYILISGRWFRSKSLERGPWEFVDGKHLPQDFSKIPESSPKAGVLASVPGTGPAKEAVIANSVPQTATITRSQARLDVKYDGTPQFKTIDGTGLQYAVNTATPVIRVNDKNYFAVENAVWFVGPAPTGPWVVASSVPPEIYSIPPSSPLHYVTYVKVYDSTPEVVHVGYTPGYYGTAVSSTTTTVVYGTGFYYPPYVGTYWYGAPYTYGVGVASTWSSETGWSLTLGVGYSPGGFYYPWWGPWGYYGSCCWGTAWGYGWGGYTSANVYGRWGNTAYAGTRAAWANPYTGNYGAGSRATFQNAQTGTVGVAGRGTNTNVYTGSTRGGRGVTAYNPHTGVVAGAGAGYAGNIYSGEGVAGRGAAAYNPNTGRGVAVGGNNVYAGEDGSVYRYDRQNGNWSHNTGNGWQSTSRPQASVAQQQQARSIGQQRTQNFSRSMGGAGMGGARMGGGRRR
jgi:hypothetical protein